MRLGCENAEFCVDLQVRAKPNFISINQRLIFKELRIRRSQVRVLPGAPPTPINTSF